MTNMSNGQNYMVNAGRRKGSRVTIIKQIDRTFVMTANEKGKERKYNVAHLEPAG